MTQKCDIKIEIIIVVKYSKTKKDTLRYINLNLTFDKEFKFTQELMLALIGILFI